MRPPRQALAFLRWFCREDYIDEIEGDLTELFEKEYGNSPNRASWNFTWSVLKHFRPGYIKSFRNSHHSYGMYNNYIKIAWRNLWNNRIFSFINISGLSVGLACCILIFLFIQHELSYDRFHERADHIYRITSTMPAEKGGSQIAVTPAPWVPLMKKDFPEIEEYTRLLKDDRAVLGLAGEQHFYETDLLYADSTLFKVFSISILHGDRQRALARPNTIVLTEETARKYFGKTDVVGRSLEVTSSGNTFNAEVTAVVKALPSSSHLTFSSLVSMSTFGDMSRLWPYHMFQSYVLLNDNALASSLESKFPSFVDRYITNNPEADGKTDIHLQPITDIHLRSRMIDEIGTNGNIMYVYVFEGVALFILLTACFNFTNLTTAKSFARAKEVGLRKVVGAEKRQLLSQFLSETVMFTLISLVIAIGIAYLLLPLFANLSGRDLSIDLLSNTSLLTMLSASAIGVGLLAGLYPAGVLSAFKPIEVLKGKFIKSTKGVAFRKVLVTLQFVVSITLIACAFIVGDQLKYLQDQNLGFNKENVMIVTLPQAADSARLESFKTGLQRSSEVISVAASSAIPSEKIAINQVNDGSADLTKGISMMMLFVDPDFIPTMQMELVTGRSFDRNLSTDFTEGFVINEEAVKKLGMSTASEAIGKPIQWITPTSVIKRGNVIGVARDFNMSPLRSAIQPLVMHYRASRLQYLYVRFNQNNSDEVLATVQRRFNESYPNQSFDYAFLDDTLNSLYNNEQRLSGVVSTFSFLAIFIACLGVFGLSFYSIQQRTKEIGIRKVLGAPVIGIATQLLQEFVKPVLMASCIATPIAWYSMHEWLKGFAYHVPISWTVFAIVTGIVLALTVLTMIVQSVNAAMENPVNSLRSE